MKQDDPGESDLSMELAQPARRALVGAGYRRRGTSHGPERGPGQASSRGWAKGDYRSFADESRLELPIFVLTNEPPDPWERPGGPAFPPSLNDRKEFF